MALSKECSMKTEKVAVITPDNFEINIDEMPKHEIDALCRVILRGTARAMQNPKFVAEYERRLAERKARGAV